MNPNNDPQAKVKNSGKTIEIAGLFIALLNLVIMIFALSGVIGAKMSLMSIIIASLSALSVIIGIVFVIIGGKIRKDPTSKSNKSRLLAVLVVSLIVLISNLIYGKSSSTIIPMILVVTSIIGMDSFKKIRVN